MKIKKIYQNYEELSYMTCLIEESILGNNDFMKRLWGKVLIKKSFDIYDIVYILFDYLN